MRFGRSITFATLALLSLWGNQAWGKICDNALTLRVNDGGLNFLAEQVRVMVPKNYEFPHVDAPVGSTSFRIRGESVVADLEMTSLKLQMSGSALQLRGSLNLDAEGDVAVGYGSFSTSACRSDIRFRDLELDVVFQLQRDGDRISATVENVRVSVDNNRSDIAFSECALGGAITAILDFARDYYMGTIQKWIDKLAKDKLAALLEDQLNGAIDVSTALDTVQFNGHLSGVATDANGVLIDLHAGTTTLEVAPESCISQAALDIPELGCDASPAQMVYDPDVMFGARVSEGLVGQSLHSAWLAGKLCLDSAALESPTVNATVQKLGATLGLPDADLAFRVKLQQPPVLEFRTDHGLQLKLDGLTLELEINANSLSSAGMTLEADLLVSATPRINVSTNSVLLDLHAAEVKRFQLKGRDDQRTALQIDPARLQRFLSDVVVPLLRVQMESSQLSPSVMSAGSYLVEVRDLKVADGHLQVQFDAHSALPTTDDEDPPQTVLRAAPDGIVGPQVVTLQVAGSDNDTPTPLLRFKVRIDGGEWTEPSYGGLVSVVTHNAFHTVEVAAVDRSNNVDASPLVIELEVDAVPPEIVVLDRPDRVLTEGSAGVRFKGSDDVTASDQLKYHVDLLKVDRKTGDMVKEDALTLPADRISAKFDNLANGLYTARLIVEDTAGNVTSQDVGFLVSSDSGCQVVQPHNARMIPLWGLLLMVFFVSRSRRMRR